MMAWPVVVVTSGGLPITLSTNGLGLPYEVAANGFGQAVTFVPAGGLPVVEGAGVPLWASAADDWADFAAGTGTATLLGLTDTHAHVIWAPNAAGVYQSYAANVLPRNDNGVVTVRTSTNKCTNFNANPTALTNVSKGGDAASTLTVVSDTAALAAAGLANICANGNVYKLDNSAGVGDAFINFNGVPGNLNAHIGSAWVRGGTGWMAGSWANEGFVAFGASASYRRVNMLSVVPADVNTTFHVRADAGQVIYVTLNQYEQGSFVSQPIVVAGSAAAVNGNRPRLTGLGSKLAVGVSGFFQVDIRGLAGLTTPRTIEFDDGTTSNVVRVGYDTTGSNYRIDIESSGPTQGNVQMIPSAMPSGIITVAFAATTNFEGIRKTGQAQSAPDTSVIWPVMDRLVLGGRDSANDRNSYQSMRKMALKYGAQSQATLDAAYAAALLA